MCDRCYEVFACGNRTQASTAIPNSYASFLHRADILEAWNFSAQGMRSTLRKKSGGNAMQYSDVGEARTMWGADFFGAIMRRRDVSSAGPTGGSGRIIVYCKVELSGKNVVTAEHPSSA